MNIICTEYKLIFLWNKNPKIFPINCESIYEYYFLLSKVLLKLVFIKSVDDRRLMKWFDTRCFHKQFLFPILSPKIPKLLLETSTTILRVKVLYLCVTYRKRVACCMYMAIKIEQCQRTDLHRVLTKDYLSVFLNLLS